MRSLKKIVAILVTLTMLLGAVALTANAGDVPQVVLRGRTQMEKGDTFEVDLFITGEEAGGAQGTITYDTSVFTYTGIEFSDDFITVNKINVNEKDDVESVVKVNQDEGTVSFMGINPGNDIVWFTLSFATSDTAKTANISLGSGVLELMSAEVDGKKAFAHTFIDVLGSTDGPGTVQLVTPGQVDMSGATIRATATVGNQDIKFEADIDYKEDLTIVEYGVVFLPDQLLNGYELVADPNFDYNPDESKVTKAAIAKSTNIQGNKTTLRATLKGSASFNASALAQVDIAARAYLKLSDGSVEYIELLYSNNDKDGTYIDNGYARKSIIGVAKAMADYIIGQTGMDVTYTEAVADSAAVDTLLNTSVLDADQQTAILEFVKANTAILATRS